MSTYSYSSTLPSSFPHQINMFMNIHYYHLTPNSRSTCSRAFTVILLPPQQGTMFTIRHVDRHTEGTFVCTANNGVGKPSSARVSVIVEYKPVIVTREVSRNFIVPALTTFNQRKKETSLGMLVR